MDEESIKQLLKNVALYILLYLKKIIYEYLSILNWQSMRNNIQQTINSSTSKQH